ncbi:MAG: B12-binding domain-containing radical SAM protein [Spirochaetales bacterium]|nr:B12-binding domain-containing radical SAM protein [Spirochaetales bacterium]
MKITFINPRTTSINTRTLDAAPAIIKEVLVNSSSYRKKVDFTRKSFGALGLLTIAGMIPRDIEVEYFDENLEDIDLEQRNFDLVALSGNLDQINRALAICDTLRKLKVPMVAGGPAVTTFPELYTRKGVSVIEGEGELLFKIFLEDFLRGEAKSLYNEAIYKVGYLDMRQSPVPRFDIAAKYPYTFIGCQITRGCPFHCNYCQVTEIFGNKSRYKDMDQIIEEIKIIKRYWPESFFFFYSDNPFTNRKYTMELFQKIYDEHHIDLGRWGAMANVTIYKDEPFLRQLTARGPVSFLGIGFESLSEQTLGSIDNNLKLKYVTEYEPAIKKLREFNINPVGYFMYGFENSKIEDLEYILDFIKRNKIYAEWSRLTPMPGTILYKQLKEEYESEYGEIKKRILGEWGILINYLKKKSNLKDEDVHFYLSELYKVLFSTDKFVDIDVPFCPLF